MLPAIVKLQQCSIGPEIWHIPHVNQAWINTIQAGRQAGRQTDRQTDRQAGRQAGRQADTHTDTQTHTHTHIHTHWVIISTHLTWAINLQFSMAETREEDEHNNIPWRPHPVWYIYASVDRRDQLPIPAFSTFTLTCSIECVGKSALWSDYMGHFGSLHSLFNETISPTWW